MSKLLHVLVVVEVAVTSALKAQDIYVVGRGAYENETTLRFDVIRGGSSNFVQTVDFYTANGTAIAGLDYRSTSGAVTFAINETVKMIEIPLIDDGVADGDKEISLVLTNPVPCANLQQSGLWCDHPSSELPPISWGCEGYEGGTIRDNEHPPTRIDPSFPFQQSMGLRLPDNRTLLGRTMFLRDGSVDDSFKLGGNDLREFSVIHALQDGKLLAVASPKGAYQWRIVRLSQNGAVDPSFRAQDVDIQFRAELASGRLLLHPWDGRKGTLFRVNTDGTRDTTFQVNLTQAWFRRVVERPNGKLLATVFFDQGDGTTRSRIVRLEANGEVDPTFRMDPGEIAEVFLRTNGKMVVTRRDISPKTAWEVVQVNEDGSLDPSFAFGFPSMGGVDGWVEQADGRILITQGFSVRRINPDGSMDPGFMPQFHSRCTQVGLVGPTLQLGPSGEIMFGGFFDSVDGFPVSGFVRLLDKAPRPDFRLFSSEVSTMTNVARISVVRTGPTSEPASVEFTTLDGSAKAGTDYVGQSGVISFGPLEVSKEIPLSLLKTNGLVSLFIQFSNPLPASTYGVTGANALRVKLPPRIAIGSVRPSSAVKLEGTVEGTTYLLESSSDLAQWRVVASRYATGGAFEFESVEGNSRLQFYRVRVAE